MSDYHSGKVLVTALAVGMVLFAMAVPQVGTTHVAASTPIHSSKLTTIPHRSTTCAPGQWNLTADFGSSNPQPDSCGDANVWYYLMGTSLSSKLPSYATTFGLSPSIPGLDVWYQVVNLAPYIGKNTTGSTQNLQDPTGGSGHTVAWPPNTISVYPQLTGGPVVVGWQSPIQGVVDVSSRVVVYDALGSCAGAGGLQYVLSLNGTTLTSGSVPNSHLAEQDPAVSDVAVTKGDVLYLSVTGVSPVRCATTGLDMTITAQQGQVTPTPATPTATDTSSPTPSRTATPTTTPVSAAATVVISPTSGTPLQTIVMNGTHFGASEVVKVFWDTVGTTPLIMPSTTGGAFVAALILPQARAGTHTLIAVGQTSGQTAHTTIQIKPAIFLSPTSGTAGSTVRLTGMGFGTRETVEGLWYPGAHLLTTGSSNAVGTVALSFTVPLSPTGTYTVVASGRTTTMSAARTFTVTGRPSQ